MTSYAQAAARGRAAAHETNTRYKMRTIVEYREVQRDRSNHHTGETWQITCSQLLGDCGHVLETSDGPRPLWGPPTYSRIGQLRRCPQCPADPPKPIPVDHCTYGIGGEFGERPCPTRARFNDPDGYGLLCRKHHNHLLRGGYLTAPAPQYRPTGPVQYLPPTPPPPPTPTLSPPKRGHLRLVTNNTASHEGKHDGH